MHTSLRPFDLGRLADSVAARVALLALAMASLVSGFAVVLADPAAAANPTYQTTDAVSLRTSPTAAATGVPGLARGASFRVDCQVEGEPHGSRGNRLYFRTVVRNQTAFVPDAWTNSPHLANQPPIAGIPLCGSTPAPAPTPPPAGQAASNVGVWVGSPVNATFGLAGHPDTLPGQHHKLVKASPANDFSVDLSRTGRQASYLYVAPANGADNGRVTTVISQIIDDNACRNGGGGDLVTVQIRVDGTTVGQVTYAHLDRNPNLSQGQTVSRWGTFLGHTADNLRGSGSDCWTGPHMHLELRASRNFACWNKGFALGQAISTTNFLGFVSGPSTASTSRPCP